MTHPTDLEYTIQIWKEGEQFMAHAMPLDVMTREGQWRLLARLWMRL
jgi:hypothetical protein